MFFKVFSVISVKKATDKFYEVFSKSFIYKNDSAI